MYFKEYKCFIKYTYMIFFFYKLAIREFRLIQENQVWNLSLVSFRVEVPKKRETLHRTAAR